MQLCLSLCLSVCAMCGAYVAPPTWTYLHLISLTAASGYVDLSVCLSVYMTEAAPYGQQASFLQVMADLSVCLYICLGMSLEVASSRWCHHSAMVTAHHLVVSSRFACLTVHLFASCTLSTVLMPCTQNCGSELLYRHGLIDCNVVQICHLITGMG